MLHHGLMKSHAQFQCIASPRFDNASLLYGHGGQGLCQWLTGNVIIYNVSNYKHATHFFKFLHNDQHSPTNVQISWTSIEDRYLGNFQWNYHRVNATKPRKRLADIGIGFDNNFYKSDVFYQLRCWYSQPNLSDGEPYVASASSVIFFFQIE